MIPTGNAEDKFEASWSLFLPYFVVVLVAYGFTMFNLTLASDEWLSLQQTEPFYWLVIAQGRWLSKLIWQAADDISFAPAFTLAVLCVAYFLFALICCWCLGLKRKGAILIFTCVLICFPINSEPFSFKMAHLIFAAAIGFASLSGLAIVRGFEQLHKDRTFAAGFSGVLAAFFFMLSAALYQSLALFGCAIVLMKVVGILREKIALRPALSRIVVLLVFASATVVVGLVFYFISVRVASSITSVQLLEGSRYAVSNSLISTWGEFVSRAVQGFEVLYDLLFAGNTLFPKIAKITFLVAAAGLLLAFAVDWEEDGERANGRTENLHGRIVRAAILCTVIALLFLLPLILGMLQKFPLYRYNNLVGVALPHAMVYALLYETARDSYWRGAVTCLAILIIGIFAFEQNRSSVTGFLLNRRDFAIASRMLERISANTAFTPFASKGRAWIVFYGDHLDDRLLPRPFSVDHRREIRHVSRTNVDCGVFNCQRMIRADYAFRLISETRMTYQTSVWPKLPLEVTPEEKQRLSDRIAAAHPWPAPDAVIFDTNVIVIVLQPPG